MVLRLSALLRGAKAGAPRPFKGFPRAFRGLLHVLWIFYCLLNPLVVPARGGAAPFAFVLELRVRGSLLAPAEYLLRPVAAESQGGAFW